MRAAFKKWLGYRVKNGGEVRGVGYCKTRKKARGFVRQGFIRQAFSHDD